MADHRIDGVRPLQEARAVQPRYRGPFRLGLAGLILLVLGGAAAVATVVIAQAQGMLNSAAMDALGSVVGVDTGGDNRDPSLFLLATFVAGFVVGAFGLCLATAAGVWALVRSRARQHAGVAWVKAKPVLAEAGTRGRQAADLGRRRIGEAAARRREAKAAPVAEESQPPQPPPSQPPRGLTQGDPLATRATEPD
jgi:hypothetical protein